MQISRSLIAVLSKRYILCKVLVSVSHLNVSLQRLNTCGMQHYAKLWSTKQGIKSNRLAV